MLADVSCLQRLVNDLLELSRLQNTSFQIEKVKMNLSDVLAEAVRSMQWLAEKKNITICIKKNTSFFEFYGDYGRIRQMFVIILDNAIKFSSSDQIIDVVMNIEDGKCIVIITDYGSGISEKDISHIFERFHKEYSEQNISGSGLGLSIAKQIALRYDIYIECESMLNQGTSFSFTFKGI